MYIPDLFPSNEADLHTYLKTEFNKLSSAFNAPDLMMLNKLSIEPVRPRDGMIVYADGQNWDPISMGEGFYGYYNSQWNKIG